MFQLTFKLQSTQTSSSRNENIAVTNKSPKACYNHHLAHSSPKPHQTQTRKSALKKNVHRYVADIIYRTVHRSPIELRQEHHRYNKPPQTCCRQYTNHSRPKPHQTQTGISPLQYGAQRHVAGII